MLTKYFVKQKIAQMSLLVGTGLLLLTACDSNNTANTNVAPTSSTVNAASAVIKHTPSGTVQLMWNPTTHALMVHLALTGLAPNSVHPAHIHAGSCKNEGKVLYDLTEVKADAIGFANAETKVSNVAEGVPVSGWYVNVHNGPEMANDDEGLSITCADVINPAASTKSAQNVQATLMDTFAPGQSVSGTAQLNINNNQLNVQLSVKGLVPNSKHAAHLQFGSCASQGKVLYTLKSIVANAAGEASSTTALPNISVIPMSGWYVTIHRSTDLSTQTGYDPIACGDITPMR